MENSKITFGVIRMKTATKLVALTVLFAVVTLILVAFVIGLTKGFENEEYMPFMYILTGTLLVLSGVVWIASYYSKSLQIKICISWYQSNNNRILLFKELKTSAWNWFDKQLVSTVEEILEKKLDSLEKLNEFDLRIAQSTLARVKKFQVQTEKDTLTDDHLALIKITQLESSFADWDNQNDPEVADEILEFLSNIEESPDKHIHYMHLLLKKENLAVFEKLSQSYAKKIDENIDQNNEIKNILIDRFQYHI